MVGGFDVDGGAEARLVNKDVNIQEGDMGWLLKQLTLAAINEIHPEQEWLKIYTSGSTIGMHGHAGTGVYCQELYQ